MYIRVVGLSLATLLAVGCDRGRVAGSGVAASERRTVAGFDEVSLVGGMEVELATGEAAPIELTADDNILPLVVTEVVNGRLEVSTKEPVRPKTTIKLKLQAPTLKAVVLSGAASIAARDLRGEQVSFELMGAAKVNASGRVERLTIKAEGAAAVWADGLEADHVEVEITGAGEAEVHAVQTLKVSMTGAGAVRYRGDPKIEKSIAGVGVLKKK